MQYFSLYKNITLAATLPQKNCRTNLNIRSIYTYVMIETNVIIEADIPRIFYLKGIDTYLIFKKLLTPSLTTNLKRWQRMICNFAITTGSYLVSQESQKNFSYIFYWKEIHTLLNISVQDDILRFNSYYLCFKTNH